MQETKNILMFKDKTNPLANTVRTQAPTLPDIYFIKDDNITENGIKTALQTKSPHTKSTKQTSYKNISIHTHISVTDKKNFSPGQLGCFYGL